MSSSRHLIPDELYKDFQHIAASLGYKAKGKQGKWKFIERLLEYAKLHQELFKL